uniref:Uncharacterized protein n=1 Tax=Arundo donax TaxID=35708 RepID=A0A0A9A3A1_ARUDO
MSIGLSLDLPLALLTFSEQLLSVTRECQ